MSAERAGLPRHRTVGDVMTTRVHVATPTTPFKLLVRLIEENRISAVPIVDQAGVPIGVVSEADLLLKERRHELESEPDHFHPRQSRQDRFKAHGLVAADLMTSPPVTVRIETSLPEAARVMQRARVRRLVVVDARGRIAGVASRSDLLQVFLRSDEEIRAEVTDRLLPALMPELDHPLDVHVRYNVVTLSGQVDRKSDVAILVRLVRELDGVVGINNELSYSWDDTRPLPLAPTAGARI